MPEFALQQGQRLDKKLELRRRQRVLELQKLNKTKKGQLKLRRGLATYQDNLSKKRFIVSRKQRSLGVVGEDNLFSRKNNLNQFSFAFDFDKKDFKRQLKGKHVLTVGDPKGILNKELGSKIVTSRFNVLNEQSEMNFKAQEFNDIFLPNFFPEWLEVDDLASFLKDLLKSLKVKGFLCVNSIDLLNHPKFKQKKYNPQDLIKFQQLTLRFLEVLRDLEAKHLISLTLRKPYLQNIKFEPDSVKKNLAPTIFVVRKLK